MNKIISKYQKKNYEVTEYNDEFQCARCYQWCIINIDKCREVVDENDESRIIVYCPYCGIKHRVHI